MIWVTGPLPMEDIAKMADECMRDVDEDDYDDNVEDDEDLLVGPFLSDVSLVIVLCSYWLLCLLFFPARLSSRKWWARMAVNLRLFLLHLQGPLLNLQCRYTPLT